MLFNLFLSTKIILFAKKDEEEAAEQQQQAVKIKARHTPWRRFYVA